MGADGRRRLAESFWASTGSLMAVLPGVADGGSEAVALSVVLSAVVLPAVAVLFAGGCRLLAEAAAEKGSEDEAGVVE